jgi:DNA-binding transcriptional ArsR family regulator
MPGKLPPLPALKAFECAFAMTLPAISRHLKVLEGAGLTARRVDSTKRPCRWERKGVEPIEQWLAMMRKF